MNKEIKDRSELYTSVTPNDRQKLIQEMRFYAFVHFSINTFTNKEWGNGKESLRLFNPKRLDARQWCKAIKAARMKGVVITAKHHDGFCLWQTETTEHSIKNTPYKDGKGDIVAELMDACAEYGLKLGIYLSPWDRNCSLYGTDGYMDFYIRQLTELMTGYGDIFMLWLDGACGAHLDGKPSQEYDFQRIYKTALKYQPNIVLSNCAPDVRWVGNESGTARESEWNVVPKFDFGSQNIQKSDMKNEQQSDADAKKFQKRCEDVLKKDMGSREFLSRYDEFMWYPAEVDVSIRRGWFYHRLQYFTVKSIDKLMRIYYGAVGGNSLLLLNIPPDKRGLFAQKDVKRLEEIGDLIRKEEALEIPLVAAEYEGETKDGFSAENLLKDKTFSPKLVCSEYELRFGFGGRVVDRLLLREDTDFSQRVEKFEILTEKDKERVKLFDGTVIGFNKIAIFDKIYTDNVILRITECRKEPYIKTVKVYEEGGYVPRVNRR